MSPFAECCVIIPCSTIEDFPSRLDSAGARSLLGGLTAAWHPRLIAATRRGPSWHRSDEVPPPIRLPLTSGTTPIPLGGDAVADRSAAITADSAGDVDPGFAAQAATSSTTLRRLLIVPEVCISTLPAEIREGMDRDAVSLHELPVPQNPDYHAACEVRIRVSSRDDALEKLAAAFAMVMSEDAIDSAGTSDWNRAMSPAGEIDELDFFALGYTWWQTQILTRRLRYTSNLDQVYFESRLVAAAQQMIAGELSTATQALHDCFDALAEERDHYFSSDPAIVDLTLLTPGTLDRWLEGVSHRSPAIEGDAVTTRRTGLATPENILVDESVASGILKGDTERRGRFQACLKFAADGSSDDPHRAIGWCGGGPGDDFSFDASSIASCEKRIGESIRTVQESGAAPLAVYARLGGGVAGEWIPAIAAAGFRGIVPIDFIGGRGFDDESKVLMGEGDYEIEALTAKPIDADDESSFLTLSARLGEAIDRGEIATGLLVHWPGGGCDSFHDVRRAASWSLCLGKFWRIDEYFTDGERPFHHGTAPNLAPAPVQTVGDLYERRVRLAADLAEQRDNNLLGFAALLDPSERLTAAASRSTDPISGVGEPANVPHQIATALGYTVDIDAVNSGAPPANVLVLHPTHPAARTSLTVAGKVSANTGSVFHAESAGSTTRLIADAPAWGFALAGAAATKQPSDRASARSPLQKALRWCSGGSRKMIDDHRFSNEFMEVTIDRHHGGIDAVYSGPSRGNRFSMRLMIAPRSKVDPESKTDATDSPWQTVCTRMEAIENTKHRAIMELAGEFRPRDVESSQTNSATTAPDHPLPTKWQAQYRLERGGRRLLYRVRFDVSTAPATTIADAWKTSPVLRMALPDASPVVRAISREKLIRTSSRSFTSTLGFVIDEENRSTLIACAGAAAHRRCGNRFFDTIVATEPGEPAQRSGDETNWSPWDSFAIGFDVRQPVASAKSFAMADRLPIVPVKNTAGDSSSRTASALPQRGWLMHPSPASLDVQVVSVGRVTGPGDEPACMALHLRVIQTASRAVAASLRFCRDVHSACEVSSLARPFENAPVPGVLSAARLQEISNAESIAWEGDRVSWSQRSHGVIHLVVLFPLSDQT